MKLLSTLALVLVTLSFFGGCSEDIDSDNLTIDSSLFIKDVFPLKVGNEWTYLRTEYRSDGSIYRTITSKARVDSVYTYKGISGFMGTFQETFQDDVDFFYYAGRELRFLLFADDKYDVGVRYPMAVGDSITVSDSLHANGYRLKTVLTLRADNVTVTVPAGTFSCLAYDKVYSGEKDGVSASSAHHFYFAFGVGIIKREMETPFGINSSRDTVELVNYTLK